MLKRLVKDTKLALRQGETIAARFLAQRALALEPQNAVALDVMAQVEAADRNYAQSRTWHEKAVAAEPQNALVKISFASTLTENGAFPEAKDLLLAAIEDDPVNGMAYQRLAWIHKAVANDRLIDKAEKLKRDNRVSRTMRVKALYALGKWYDDLGDYDKAFTNYREANELTSWEFDKEQFSVEISRIKSIWSSDFLRARNNVGFQNEKPVFIIGMPRSGSTLLEKNLCADPRAVSLGERPDIVKIVFTISANHPRQLLYPEWAPDLSSDAYRRFGNQYVDHFEKLFPQAQRFVDKTLTNYKYAGFIKTMLPKAHIIEARRHPVDTCLSCYFTDLNFGHKYKTDLSALGFTYRHYADLMNHWRNTIENVIRVDYEDFVQDADQNASLLRNETGLLGTADGRDATSKIKTWSAYQARQPVYHSSVGRWKNYEKHLLPLIESLKDLIP